MEKIPPTPEVRGSNPIGSIELDASCSRFDPRNLGRKRWCALPQCYAVSPAPKMSCYRIKLDPNFRFA